MGQNWSVYAQQPQDPICLPIIEFSVSIMFQESIKRGFEEWQSGFMDFCRVLVPHMKRGSNGESRKVFCFF